MPARELNRRGGGAAVNRDRDNTREAVESLNRWAADFLTVLPSHLNGQQWMRLAAGMLRKNPSLASTALQNPRSFFGALMDCARLGLNPGDTYHLVPIGGEVVGITDYKGEIELIYRAGMVRKIVCQVVYKGEDFQFNYGEHDKPVHRIDWTDTERTTRPLWLVYAYAEFKDGGISDVVVMDEKAIGKIKAVSKTARSSSSPWQQWEDRMWKKTAVKQLSTWVPSSAEFRIEQLRAESAVAQTRWGQVAPTRDYEELPAAPMPIDATGANLDGPPQGMNPATGELPAEPARPVEERPDVRNAATDDDLPYDPTTDPNFGQNGDNS